MTKKEKIIKIALLVWTILTLPFIPETSESFSEFVFSSVYYALIIYSMGKDLKIFKGKGRKRSRRRKN